MGGVFGMAVLGAIFATTMTSSMIGAAAEVPGLPAEAVPYVTEIIEDSGSQMGMGGMDVESLREAVPAEAMRLLIEGAVADAADEYLPVAARGAGGVDRPAGRSAALAPHNTWQERGICARVEVCNTTEAATGK